MLENHNSLTEILSQQMLDYLVYETENRQSLIDPYPYVSQGIIFSLLLSIIFWCSIVSVVILVF